MRIWSASPAGTLRIYLDGDTRPAIEAPFAGLLRGEVSPFVAPLAHVTARGYNLYFPIPYRSRCVVTVDSIVRPDPFTGRPMAKLYYQIGYRTYPAAAAARVRPYSAAEVTRARRARSGAWRPCCATDRRCWRPARVERPSRSRRPRSRPGIRRRPRSPRRPAAASSPSSA